MDVIKSFIEFDKVSKKYTVGDENILALNEVSFSVEKGAFTVILGPSGSGKSTILNLLGGMDRATGGDIQVGKRVVSKLSEKELTIYRRHDIGFVFQFYNLVSNLTAYENIDMAAKLSKNPMKAEEALDAVGLLRRKNNFPSQMSGGELQRISIARALSKNPQLLLCDEPTGALDSETGKKILILLQKMSRDYDTAVVVVTHNAAIAPAADKLIQLRNGKVEKMTENASPMLMEEVNW
jgi:putative ABC transport system ATP-binding protein